MGGTIFAQIVFFAFLNTHGVADQRQIWRPSLYPFGCDVFTPRRRFVASRGLYLCQCFTRVSSCTPSATGKFNVAFANFRSLLTALFVPNPFDLRRTPCCPRCFKHIRVQSVGAGFRAAAPDACENGMRGDRGLVWSRPLRRADFLSTRCTRRAAAFFFAARRCRPPSGTNAHFIH